jgi:peptidoglycan/LPS O-acetylase OafA/YrhL
MACLMVVATHSAFYSRLHESGSGRWLSGSLGDSLLYLVSRMGIGVHIFFVVSGYCIAATADSTRRRPRAMLQYFKRRFRRIFPPYWAALSLTALVVLIASFLGLASLFSDEKSPIPQPESLTALQWLGNITLTETWRNRVLPADPKNLLLGPAWTLCYEEQFYVACGLILLVWPRKFFAGIAVVSVLMLCLAPWTALKPDSRLVGCFLDGTWFIFAAGILVYYQINYASGRNACALLLLLVFSFIASVVYRYGLLPAAGGGNAEKEKAFEFVIGFAFALVILFLNRWDNYLSELRVLRPIAFCGAMCYSLYLVHWPIAKAVSHSLAWMGVDESWPTLLVTIPIAMILSLGVSRMFYLWVERRFLNSPSHILSPRASSAKSVVQPVLARDHACPVSGT